MSEPSDYDCDSLNSEGEDSEENISDRDRWKDGFVYDGYGPNSAQNHTFQIQGHEDSNHNIDIQSLPQLPAGYKTFIDQSSTDQNIRFSRSPIQGQPYLDSTLINQFHFDTSKTLQDVDCTGSQETTPTVSPSHSVQQLKRSSGPRCWNNNNVQYPELPATRVGHSILPFGANISDQEVVTPTQVPCGDTQGPYYFHTVGENEPSGRMRQDSLTYPPDDNEGQSFYLDHSRDKPAFTNVHGGGFPQGSTVSQAFYLHEKGTQDDLHSDDSVELISHPSPRPTSESQSCHVSVSKVLNKQRSEEKSQPINLSHVFQGNVDQPKGVPQAMHRIDTGQSEFQDAEEFQSASDGSQQSSSTSSPRRSLRDLQFRNTTVPQTAHKDTSSGSVSSSGKSMELPTPDDEFYDAVEEPDQQDQKDKQVSAKLRASLSWILYKAYRDSIPAEFQDPFYETDQGSLQIKPHLVRVLASSEVYCQACANMFPKASQWQGHWSIIQVLSRKGIYVTGSDDTSVTETVLMKTAPFNADAHLALISSLMLAYTCETVTVERVVQAVRRITTFNASSELPTGMEDTVRFWINKVCHVLVNQESKPQQVLQGETNQRVRIVSRTPVSGDVKAPVLNNLIEDMTDGCCLALLISFYCPSALNYADICLKENLGIADSLYNLRLVKTFCERNLPPGSFSFSYEDLLYTPETLRENILSFIAELFFCFEIHKIDGTGSRSSSAAQSLSGVPPVSNATKRSFQKNEESRFNSNPELNKSSNGSNVPSRQGPLLHKRHTGKTGVNEEPVHYLEPPKHPRRALSLSSPQERDSIRQSVIAWQEQEDPNSRGPSRTSQVKQSQESHNSALLANVSIDSELNESFADDQLGSINFDSDKSQSPQPTFGDRQGMSSNLRDPNHPDYIEVESVNSHQSNMNTARSDKLEPLMPAILRPAKEKVSNHTKAQERGEPDSRKKTTSPTKPRKSRSSPVSQGDVTVEAVVTLPSDVTSSDETVVTPLPEDQLSARSGEGGQSVLSGSGEGDADSQKKPFDAFYINPDISVEVSLPPVSSQSPRAQSVGSTHSDGSEVAVSYTIDQAHTIDTARAAGIPVVHSSDPGQIRRTTSRDGSVSSSRSSGDFSDHESHKIHLDHKVRETNAMQARSRQSPDVGEVQKPKLVITDQLPKTLSQTLADRDKRPQTTNFAEIKRIKDTFGNVDNSGFVYMQNGQDQKDSAKAAALKSSFLRKQADSGGKKTTFATLPNETTWSAQRAASSQAQASQRNGTESSQPVTGELAQLRLKLDEKRKEIERKKQRMELQQQKMRQRLGKAAFMRVVSRHMDDSPDGTITEASQGEHSAAEIEERLGQNALETHDAHRPTSLVDGSQRGRPFSREGIQQTIDNVRKKWFREDDLLGGARHPDDDMMSTSQEERLGPTGPTGPTGPGQPVAPPQHPMTDSQHSSSSQHSTGSQPESYEAYDYSLDKLNKSLTDLQGEIARLSLQQEQIKFLQSPQGYTQGGSITQVPSVPPHSLPQQIGYTSPSQHGQGEPNQPYVLHGAPAHSQFKPIQGYASKQDKHEVFRVKPEQYQPVPYSAATQPVSMNPYSTPIMSATSYQPHPPSTQTPVYHASTAGAHAPPTQPHIPPASLPQAVQERKIPTPPGYTLPPHSPDAVNSAGDTASEDSSTTQDSAANGNGFFVSFGDETPKRPKPKLGKDRVKKEARTETPPPITAAPVAAPVPAATATPAAAATAPASQTTPPSSGFVVQDREITPDKYSEDEMAKKKEKIRLMQIKRKEDQERKRLEKEQEMAKQRETQRLKQEESERKKAEEKARREQIYQQYLLRKQQQEDEENGVERPPERAPAKSKPRPKSMFVKATESPPRHEDEATSARSTPRPSLQFPKSRGKLRKAVSCNTLTQNGRPGGSTFRRPPSPDLYRLRHGNRSNDSSDAGSTAGSDYSGPKLFVKPSSKSNRHIIVNAISHCCLAGIVNTETKNKVLEIIAQSDAKHFLILFRDAGCQFKGLYTYAPESEDIFKIHGVGPRQLSNKMVEKFYKYNSGAKSFTEVKSTKHISVSIDAVVLHNALWKTGKSSAATTARR